MRIFWTYDGQAEPVKTAAIEFPKGSTGDRVFTAHYRKASMPVDIKGLEVIDKLNENVCQITVPAGVEEIVVSDIFSNGSFIGTAKIRYYGDEKPTVLCGERTEVIFEKLTA